MKKYFLLGCTLLFTSLLWARSDKPCSYDGIELHGKVKVVKYNEDIKVKVVEYNPDIEVKIVEYGAYDCGEWEFVEYDEDFKIKYVEYNEDIRVKFVEYNPGVK